MVKKEKLLEKANVILKDYNFLNLKAYYLCATGYSKDKQEVIDFGIHQENIV